MAHYSSSLIQIDSYGFILAFMAPNCSLWLDSALFILLCLLVTLYNVLWLVLIHYGSIPNGSLWLQMPPFSSCCLLFAPFCFFLLCWATFLLLWTHSSSFQLFLTPLVLFWQKLTKHDKTGQSMKKA